MPKKKVVIVFGTRPEIIKISPLIPKLEKAFDLTMIHTGQHYSKNMSDTILKDLHIRKPDYNLKVGSGTQAYQVGTMTQKIEKVLLKIKPDYVVVQGDTNSTLAGALAASKQNIKVAHVEAGARCGNKDVPEELNRVMVDHISDLLFCYDSVSKSHLKSEGLVKNVYCYSNTAYEACKLNMQYANDRKILTKLGFADKKYALVTIHRAGTVENHSTLKKVIGVINHLSKRINIIFVIHPRTQKKIKSLGYKISDNIKVIDPIGYLDFIKLINDSEYVLSDSGGVVDESVTLNRPLFIFRNETERTEIIKGGKAKLLKTSPAKSQIISTLEKYIKDANLKKMRSARMKVDYNVAEKITKQIKGNITR